MAKRVDNLEKRLEELALQLREKLQESTPSNKGARKQGRPSASSTKKDKAKGPARNPGGSSTPAKDCRCCLSLRRTTLWKERDGKTAGAIYLPCFWGQTKLGWTAQSQWSVPANWLRVLQVRRQHRSRPGPTPKELELLTAKQEATEPLPN